MNQGPTGQPQIDDAVVESYEVHIEEIDHFDARGKFQVYGRGGHLRKNRIRYDHLVGP